MFTWIKGGLQRINEVNAKRKELANSFIATGLSLIRDQRGAADMKAMMLGFILLILGLALLGPAISFVDAANTAALSSYTGATAVLGLVPLFVVLGILAIAAMQVIKGFKGG